MEWVNMEVEEFDNTAEEELQGKHMDYEPMDSSKLVP
jgi:hypothetical protein